jgi:hypothetical protein
VIKRFAGHEDWYLREAAFWAIVGLHKSITGEEFAFMSRIYHESRHVFERSSYDAGFRVILKADKAAFDRTAMMESVRMLGETTHQPQVMLGYGTGGVHEAAHRTMMILNHFDPGVYRFMIDDLLRYLAAWEPYYQHSVWLISGSKWQPGVLKILDGLGKEGAPIVKGLKAVLARYHQFDPRRIEGAGKDLEAQIIEAVRKWESTHGTAE